MASRPPFRHTHPELPKDLTLAEKTGKKKSMERARRAVPGPVRDGVRMPTRRITQRIAARVWKNAPRREKCI